MTADLIEYQLETSHTDNDFAALKAYFTLPCEDLVRGIEMGFLESWLTGIAELLKLSLRNWKKNMVPGRAIFYKASVDGDTWKPRYVYVYQFRARGSLDAAVARLAQQFGGTGTTPEEQLRAAGIYHHRISYMPAYEQPMIAMLFSVNPVIRERPALELPERFYDQENPDFKGLPLEDRETVMNASDGAIVGRIIIAEDHHDRD